MAAKATSGKALLFLYEGETEAEFYDVVFEKILPNPSIKIKRKNLEGIYNINKKVANAIDNYLENNPKIQHLDVFVAIDREGPDETEITLDKKFVINKLNNSRLIGIELLIITQHLESALFIDIEGIYAFLKTPKSERKPDKYNNYKAFTHSDLSALFRKYGKSYVKGKRTQNFISQLDINKITNGCKDLKDGIAAIEKLIS